MKTNKIIGFVLFFSTCQSMILEGSKPALATKSNEKASAQQASSKKATATSQTTTSQSTNPKGDKDFTALIQQFVSSVDLIDAKNEKTFNTHAQQAYKLLKKIKSYITEYPAHVSKEQLTTINTALKKLPKQSPEVNKDFATIIASIDDISLEHPEQAQESIQKAQQIITKLQAEAKQNPNLAVSKEQKEAIEKAVARLPKRSAELDRLLTEFNTAIQAIPEQSSANFQNAVMKAVVADKRLLDYLQKNKPLIVKDQGDLINKYVQQFKAKLPTQLVSQLSMRK